jgi:hypothetical protein
MSRVQGIVYTPEAVDAIREQMILLRLAALRDMELEWSISLSWVIAYLADYKRTLEPI